MEREREIERERERETLKREEKKNNKFSNPSSVSCFTLSEIFLAFNWGPAKL